MSKQLKLEPVHQPQVDVLVKKWAGQARSLFEQQELDREYQRQTEQAYQDLFRLLGHDPFQVMVHVGSPPLVSIGGAFAAWCVFGSENREAAIEAMNNNLDSLRGQFTRSVEAGLSIDYLLSECRRVAETCINHPNMVFNTMTAKQGLNEYIQSVKYHRHPGSMWTTVPLIKDLEDLARGEEPYEDYGMQAAREADIRQCLGNVAKSGWTFTTTMFIVNCPRPTSIVLDNRNRFSNTEGPALEYADGYKAYFIRDIQIPRRWVEEKNSIGIADFLAETNQEKQAILLELVGWDKIVDDTEHRVIDNDVDQYGRERSLLLCKVPGFDEDVAIVRVWNSSKEPDGSRKRYGLRVSPKMRTCHEAVASTFRIAPENYKPAVET